jgi:hypothetical protein
VEAKEYTDKITEELKSTMTTLEIVLCSSMKALQKMKKPALTNSGTSVDQEIN